MDKMQFLDLLKRMRAAKLKCAEIFAEAHDYQMAFRYGIECDVLWTVARMMENDSFAQRMQDAFDRGAILEDRDEERKIAE